MRPLAGAALPPVRPSMLVQLTQAGATAEKRVVRKVFQDLQIDRPLTVLPGVPGLEVVQLQAGGPVYNATRIAADQVLALPEIGAVPVAVAMPHFLAGELVQLDWTAPTVERRFCRITVVEPNGTLLTLTPDPAGPRECHRADDLSPRSRLEHRPLRRSGPWTRPSAEASQAA